MCAASNCCTRLRRTPAPSALSATPYDPVPRREIATPPRRSQIATPLRPRPRGLATPRRPSTTPPHAPPGPTSSTCASPRRRRGAPRDAPDPPATPTDATHTMIITQCAACARPLAYDAPRRVAASVNENEAQKLIKPIFSARSRAPPPRGRRSRRGGRRGGTAEPCDAAAPWDAATGASGALG